MYFQYDDLFGALASPARRLILELIGTGVRTCTDLAKHFNMTTPAVLNHLRILERAGAVIRREQGNRIYYSVATEEVSAALVAYNLRIRTLAPTTSNAFDHAQTGGGHLPGFAKGDT